jgi:hypothetical protein
MSDYSATFPTQRPVFTQDFSNGSKIDPRATFTRASTGTFFGTDKVLSSENLLLQSENFTTTWTIQDASGAAGATAPDGGTDGYTVTAHSGSSKGPRASQSLSGKLSTNTQYTMVGHVKAGTATHGYISFRGTNSNNYAYAQIEFASPGSVSTGGVGFTSISGTVTALGSSWYRLTLTATTGSNVSGAFAFLGVNDGTAFGISGYPVWSTAGETLDVWGAQISTTQAKVYDSPTTTQIAREYQSKLQTAASGAARFEHSATDGQSAGILIESQSTNLVERSSELDAAFWNTFTTANIDANVAVSIDGTLTADLIRPTTATSGHYVQTNSAVTTVDASTYTLSAYVKAAGLTKTRLYFLRSTSPYTTAAYGLFTLTGDGSVEDVQGSATISPVGNGWYRISVTGPAVTTLTTLVVQPTDASGTATFAGDGYSGIICTGVQFELGSHASSLVSTSGATATRAADSLSVATADIGYTGGPFTLMAEATSPGETSYYAPAALHLDNSNQVVIYTNSFQGRLAAATSDGTANTLLGVRADGKTILSGDTNDLSAVMNGATPVTDSSYVLPDLSGANLYIGSRNGSSSPLNGHVKRVALYNEALSDTNLQALTS